MARVRVFNQSLLDGLVAETPGDPASPGKSREGPFVSAKQRERATQKAHLKDLEDVRTRRFERNHREAQTKAAESDRQVREHIVMHKMKQEEKFAKSFSSIMDGRTLAATIKKQQDLEDQAERNKVVRQFEEWNLEVYGKIQGRIAERVDASSTTEITARRNVAFQKFLDVSNAKGAIFRDIIIESEYDPLEVNRNCIKVRSSDLVDPTSRVLDKALGEKHMLSSAAALAAARKPKTREVLEVTDWGAGRIESTPHGFFAKMMAKKDHEVPGAPPKEVSGTWKSVIPMDHYNVAKGRDAVDAEMPKGKRMIPKLSSY